MKSNLAKELKEAGLSLVELLIVLFLVSAILIFTYRIFFSQARVITQSIEFMQVNENFRRITTYLGKDIREANQIVNPFPIHVEENKNVVTLPGIVLRLFRFQIDPSLPHNSPQGQKEFIHEIIYELIPDNNPLAPTIPRFKLVRTEYVQEKPGERTVQRTELAENIRDFMLFRNIRKPPTARNLDSIDDRIVQHGPAHRNGLGNSLIHMRVTLERTRENEIGEVYQIAMSSSFYKRGKEVFDNP